MPGFIRAALLAGAAVIGTIAGSLPAAAAYPEEGRTIHLLVGFTPGGGTDLAARLMAEWLSKDLNTSVVVENYPGAGGLEAVNRLIAAQPDGYTLALVPLPASVMLYLDAERGGQFTADDVVPIAVHDYSILGITVAGDSQWQSMEQLIEAVKAAPNSVTAASSGVLAMGHLGLLLLNQAAGVQFNWTTFESSGLMRSALLGHHIDFEVSGAGEVVAGVQSGELRLLAVYAAEREPAFPDVPTMRELGYDLTQSSTRVVIAPKGTPTEVVDTLDDAIARISADPAYQEIAESRQVSLYYLNSEDAAEFWRTTEETYRPLVESFRAQ